MKWILSLLFMMVSFNINASTNLDQVSGCAESDYIYTEAQTVTVNIVANTYSPKCLAILPGTQVTIEANGYHPLNPQAQANNPIQQVYKNTAFLFQTPGTYGYYCPRHGNEQGRGMAGAIKVIER